jgi:argininosuccinate lyase
MGKLWQKDYDLNTLVESFTVGRDYELDSRLVPADCLASMAHARMLAGIGILSQAEHEALRRSLCTVLDEWEAGSFIITRGDEDCHTAIENRLVALCGEAGKKIHTGRSRNDQVVAALRVYARECLLDLLDAGVALAKRLLQFAHQHRSVPMPGRTHMQIAMPSSVGLWAGAVAESVLDDMAMVAGAYRLNDRCPLGAAASFGVPLPLDREQVAALLGFSRVQNNVLYSVNARGKVEAIVLDALDQLGLSLSKAAEDLMLYSMPEFGYFSLPDELCSGSSIMPQKKNPDALELVRGKAASLSAAAAHVKNVVRGLPSGYNRDVQETKEPFFAGMDTALMCTRVMELTFEKLVVHETALAAGFHPEIYATDAVLERVSEGEAFRDAYRWVGTHLSELAARDPQEALARRTATGTPGNLRLDVPGAEAERISAFAVDERRRVGAALETLAGRSVSVYRLPL